jgi:uncharacterized protein YcfJ
MKTIVSSGVFAAASVVAVFGLAAPAGAAEYARVVSSTPVSGSVSVPRQECAQVQQLVQQQPSGAGALIGAIAGGVLGNQIGHGFGRAAATGVGVVAGSAIGNNVEANANPPTTVSSQRCRTVSSYESRIVGYDVVYEYNGQRYSTRLPNDPGQRLAIDIRPAAAPLDRVGPTTGYAAVPPAYVDAPTYSEAPPAYVDSAPGYYAPAPVYYGGPAYYGVPGYVAPAVIGLGIGYWVGRSWYPGYRGYYRGGYGRWH